MSIEGTIDGSKGPVLYMDQFGKLKINVNVSENGLIQHAGVQLLKTLQQALETESLPELKLVMKSFVYNEHVFVTWPREFKNFKDVVVTLKGKTETYNPDKQQLEYQTLLETLKGYEGKVIVETELYCWARKDEEKQELSIGFTPRLLEINFLE